MDCSSNRVGGPQQDGHGLGSTSTSTSNGHPCRRHRRSSRRWLPPSRRTHDATVRNHRGKNLSTGGRHHGRLWQLPESSIAEYARWIVEKPHSEQRPAERRFLWKYLNRTLTGGGMSSGLDNPSLSSSITLSERAKNMVERLEAKPESERSDVEVQFIRQFYQRQHRVRRGQTTQKKQPIGDHDGADSVIISWHRIKNDLPGAAGAGYSPGTGMAHDGSATNRHVTSLATLRESMTLLGLSSDTLRQDDVAQTMDQDG